MAVGVLWMGRVGWGCWCARRDGWTGYRGVLGRILASRVGRLSIEYGVLVSSSIMVVRRRRSRVTRSCYSGMGARTRPRIRIRSTYTRTRIHIHIHISMRIHIRGSRRRRSTLRRRQSWLTLGWHRGMGGWTSGGHRSCTRTGSCKAGRVGRRVRRRLSGGSERVSVLLTGLPVCPCACPPFGVLCLNSRIRPVRTRHIQYISSSSSSSSSSVSSSMLS